MTKIISIAGRHNCGKTTVIENIIPLLKQKGYRIATIKHAIHDFELSKEGTDTNRHLKSGADGVIFSHKNKVTLIEKVSREIDLDELIQLFKEEYDLIIVEGYKHSNIPKIEVVRKELSEELVCKKDSNLLAVITDSEKYFGIKKFRLNDYRAVVEFIEERIL